MKTTLLLLAGFALIAAQPRGQAQIIANGSFESPVVGDNAFGVAPTAWMWNVEPPPAVGTIRHGNGFFVPQDGDHYVVLFGIPFPQYGRLSQTFALTSPGPYKLRWFDKNFGFGGYSVVIMNGTVEVVGQTNYTNLEWTERVVRFSAGAGTYTLEFRNEFVTTGDSESQLDNVSLEPDLPPPLIANGSFESPALTTAFTNIAPTSWTWSGTVAGLTCRDTSFYGPAQDGNQYVAIVPNFTLPRSCRLSHTFTVTTPGNHALNWHDKFPNFGRYSVGILTGTVEIAVQTNTATGPGWNARTLPVVLPAGSYTVEFRNERLTASDQVSLIDNVSLALIPPPRLAIEKVAGSVRVSWPLPATGFNLEQASAITSSPVTGWTPVAFPYQTNTTHISVTVTSPVGNKFYRLRKP